MNKTAARTLSAALIGCAIGSSALVYAEQGTKAKPSKAEATQHEKATRTPQANTSAKLELGDIAACQPSAQLSGAVQRLVSFADPNADGRITRAEATTAANFLVGGFFFRADGNEDGIVTPKEGLQARKQFAKQQPIAARLLSVANRSGKNGPFKNVAKLLDIEYGKPVSAAEAHRAARSAVDDIFKTADANKDGTVTFDEARKASWQGAQAVGDNMFGSIDANNDGAITLAEFQKGLQDPASVAFKLADENADGRLTKQEAQAALSGLVSHIGIRNSGKTMQGG